MRKIVTAAQMQALDKNTIENHGMMPLVLMERAALAVVAELKDFDLDRTLVVCGRGNNGGDGIAAARMLKQKGVNVSIYQPEGTHTSEGCTRQEQIARSYQVTWVNNPEFREYTTIVDALFGVGLSRPAEGIWRSVIECINESGAAVVSVDMPSGVHADHGQIMGTAVKADRTVTFGFAKAGQLLYPGAACCGRLKVCDIGIYDSSKEEEPRLYALEKADLAQLPARESDGNKGTFGKVLLIAGSPDMTGAAYLCGLSAMRTGCGMIKIITPEKSREMIQKLIPEAMVSAYETSEEAVSAIKEGMEWADVTGIGPGLGQDDCAAAMVEYVMGHCLLPLVVDADGLNILSTHPDWIENHKGPCMITPHLGEMARLSGESTAKLKKNLIDCAERYADKYGVQCVLKSARTCIAVPKGRTYLNVTGNCGMATAGSGDVLTGIILGLLAQNTPFEVAGAFGVLLHGLAGDRGMEKHGTAYLMAADIIEELQYFKIGDTKGDEDEEI